MLTPPGGLLHVVIQFFFCQFLRGGGTLLYSFTRAMRCIYKGTGKGFSRCGNVIVLNKNVKKLLILFAKIITWVKLFLLKRLVGNKYMNSCRTYITRELKCDYSFGVHGITVCLVDRWHWLLPI